MAKVPHTFRFDQNDNVVQNLYNVIHQEGKTVIDDGTQITTRHKKHSNIEMTLYKQERKLVGGDVQETYSVSVQDMTPQGLGKPTWKTGQVHYTPNANPKQLRVLPSISTDLSKEVQDITKKFYQATKHEFDTD